MLKKTKRSAKKGGAKRRGKRRHAKSQAHRAVSGAAKIVLAKGLPRRPKGYLTYQKGTELIAKKMNRKGGKKGRKVCRK